MTVHVLKNLRREIGKKVETDGGRGMKTVPDGHELADVEISVDVDALARRLGVKAMRNKTGRATISWGLVKVKVVRRQRVLES